MYKKDNSDGKVEACRVTDTQCCSLMNVKFSRCRDQKLHELKKTEYPNASFVVEKSAICSRPATNFNVVLSEKNEGMCTLKYCVPRLLIGTILNISFSSFTPYDHLYVPLQASFHHL